jgi:hypoxanthine phosphoribosyltransferase
VHELSWSEFAMLAGRVRDSIRTSGWTPTAIVAIGRGGLPFGVWLSHHLSIGAEAFFAVAAYRNATDERFSERPPQATVTWAPPLERLGGQAVLVVDDIAGDGATLHAVQQLVLASAPASVRTAVLVTNQAGGATVDFRGRAVDRWVVFPWEH